MYYFAYITERFIKNINFILLFSIKSEKITKKSLEKNYYYGIISVIILYYNNEKSRKENIMKGNLQLKNYKKALCTIVVSVFSLAINNSHIMNANAGGLDYDYAGYIPGVYYASGETGNHLRDGIWGNEIDVIPKGTWFNISEVIDGTWGYISEGVQTYNGYYSGYVYLPYCTFFESSDSENNSADINNYNETNLESPEENYCESSSSELTEYCITSEYGAWLRNTPDFSEENKLGILSTGQYINASNIDGDWIYVTDTNVENDYNVYSGWVYIGNVNAQQPNANNAPDDVINHDQYSSENSDNRVFEYNNEALIYNFLVYQLGMTDQSAVGILANIKHESNFDTNAFCYDTNDLPSYGICQWNGPRYESLVSFCESNGYDYTSLDGQLAFMEHEFSTGFNTQFNQLKNTTDVFEASYYFASSYEFCSPDQWSVRSSYAVEKYC